MGHHLAVIPFNLLDLGAAQHLAPASRVAACEKGVSVLGFLVEALLRFNLPQRFEARSCQRRLDAPEVLRDSKEGR
jgi:hypothetical protein